MEHLGLLRGEFERLRAPADFVLAVGIGEPRLVAHQLDQFYASVAHDLGGTHQDLVALVGRQLVGPLSFKGAGNGLLDLARRSHFHLPKGLACIFVGKHIDGFASEPIAVDQKLGHQARSFPSRVESPRMKFSRIFAGSLSVVPAGFW